MKLRTLTLLFGGAVLAASLNAGASSLSLSPITSPDTIPSGTATNDLLSPIYGSTVPRDGYYGANVYVTQAYDVVFTYLGKEAGFTNLFELDANLDTVYTTIFSTATSSVGDTYTIAASVVATWISSNSGVIPFRYNVTNLSSTTATNGSNPDNTTSGAANFFSSVDGAATATAGNSLVTFLDDTGAGDDDNHDDMAVRISAVPLPAAAWLFGSAILGLVAVGRRKLMGTEA